MKAFVLALACLTLIGCAKSTDSDSQTGQDSNKPQGSDTASVANRLQEIFIEYQNEYNAFIEKANAAASPEELKSLEASAPDPSKTVKKAFQLMDGIEDDPAFVDAVTWVVYTNPNDPLLDSALDKLLEHHAKDPRLADIVFNLKTSDLPNALNFANKLAEQSDNKATAAAATITHAALLDESKDREKIVQLLQSVAGREGEIFVSGTELVSDAKARIFEATTLGIGATAPEIVGQDAQGQEFKLSDYRGKVVLLSVWANW